MHECCDKGACVCSFCVSYLDMCVMCVFERESQTLTQVSITESRLPQKSTLVVMTAGI